MNFFKSETDILVFLKFITIRHILNGYKKFVINQEIRKQIKLQWTVITFGVKKGNKVS